MKTAEIVKEIIAEYICVDLGIVTIEAELLDDLCADSLDLVELIMVFEERFNIGLPDEEAEKVVTVGDAIELIEKYSE